MTDSVIQRFLLKVSLFKVSSTECSPMPGISPNIVLRLPVVSDRVHICRHCHRRKHSLSPWMAGNFTHQSDYVSLSFQHTTLQPGLLTPGVGNKTVNPACFVVHLHFIQVPQQMAVVTVAARPLIGDREFGYLLVVDPNCHGAKALSSKMAPEAPEGQFRRFHRKSMIFLFFGHLEA